MDVLTGKVTPQVTRFNHDKVSTFGIGHAYTQQQWQSIYRQLVAANLLSVDMRGFGGLQLTQNSQPLLRGEQTIALRKDPEVTRKKAAKPVKKTEERILGPAPDDALWRALRTKRLDLAREQSVPPYVIFHDSSLIEIHHRKPRSLEEFATISGVGKSKLDRYGEIFIALVAAHVGDYVEEGVA